MQELSFKISFESTLHSDLISLFLMSFITVNVLFTVIDIVLFTSAGFESTGTVLLISAGTALFTSIGFESCDSSSLDCTEMIGRAFFLSGNTFKNAFCQISPSETLNNISKTGKVQSFFQNVNFNT